MREMLTIIIDVRFVCQSVCHAVQLGLHTARVIPCSLCQSTVAFSASLRTHQRTPLPMGMG